MDEFPSTHFYDVRERTFGRNLLIILLVVLVLVVIYLAILLISRIPKKCNGPPAAPTNVRAGYVSSTAFRVLWNPVPDVERYTVYVGQTQGFSRVNAIKIVTTGTPSADATDLTLYRTYYIRVSATNNCAESVDSVEVSYLYVPT